MTYRDNVTALAKSLGITNDPGLREEDILVSTLVFMTFDDEPVTIEATDMNRAGRLFFQALLVNRTTTHAVEHLAIGCEVLTRAGMYFAELWDEPIRGKRLLLDTLRVSQHVQIHRKKMPAVAR